MWPDTGNGPLRLPGLSDASTARLLRLSAHFMVFSITFLAPSLSVMIHFREGMNFISSGVAVSALYNHFPPDGSSDN